MMGRLFGMFAACLALNARAAVSEAEFLAARMTATDLVSWLSSIKSLPVPIGIFAIRVNAPLDQEFADVLEGELLRQVQESGQTKLVACMDCKAPQLRVVEDRIIVTKGAPDLPALRELGKKTAVASFLVIDAHRTKLRVHTQATIHDTATGEVIDAQSFTMPAVNISDNAAHIFLAIGPSLAFKQNSESGEEDESTPLTFTAAYMEELGSLKGGLKFQITSLSGYSPLITLAPTLAPRLHFSGSSVSLLFPLSIGFGFGGAANGIALGAGVDCFIGSFTMIGIDLGYNIPFKSTFDPRIAGYAGIHVGFSIGR